MGLFDGYFDPSAYQDAGGSLIDRLRAQLAAQSDYQPSAAGLPPSPMNAQASAPAPQPQNAPIGVGDYQMPRIGSGFPAGYPEHDPQTGETVPPAAPVQTPAFLQPQHSAGGFGGAMRGAMANMQGGPLGMIAGGIGGAMGMGQGTAQEQQQRTAQQQYAAYVAGGMTPQQAMLSVVSPEAAKTLIPQALSNKQKYAKIGQDGLGREQYGFVDETNQTVNGKPISQQPQGDAGGGLGDMSLTGKPYLASIPAAQRGTVQAMVEGRMAPPSSFALSKPYWQNMIAAAQNVDPSFDATQWGGRVAGVVDFSKGKSSEMVRSANQTIGHVGDLIGKMDALSNGDYPLKNKIGNYLNSQQGGAAVTGFKQTAHAVADELSKVFKGAGISDHEIKQWEENLSPDMSPAQQHEAVTTAMSLLQHSLSALEEKRLNSIGPMAAEKAGPLLKPDAQAAVDRIQKWANGKAAEAAATPAAPGTTKTGVSWSVVQ
jgi:hypothetical protein